VPFGSEGLAPSVVTSYMAGQRGLSLDSYGLIAKALGLRMVETSGRGIRQRQPAKGADTQEQLQNSSEVDPQAAPNPTREMVSPGTSPLHSGTVREQ
jgi:hypothetical protein